MAYFKYEKDKKAVTFISVGLSIIAVLFLAMAKEPYAITVTFLLLLIKGILLYKQAKAGWEVSITIPAKYEDEIYKLYPTYIYIYIIDIIETLLWTDSHWRDDEYFYQ